MGSERGGAGEAKPPPRPPPFCSNPPLQVMNMYGDLVMDAVPDKVGGVTEPCPPARGGSCGPTPSVGFWGGSWTHPLASRPQVHFFNSFFYDKLRTRGYEGVQRWTKNVRAGPRGVGLNRAGREWGAGPWGG